MVDVLREVVGGLDLWGQLVDAQSDVLGARHGRFEVVVLDVDGHEARPV